MARMKKAIWLGEHSPQIPMRQYDIFCIHTIVGHDPAHAAHFSVGGDGKLSQSRDTRWRSAANLEGNHRIIACENEDMGPPFPDWSGSNVPPFTKKQIESIAQAYAWSHLVHDIPLQLCPNSRPGSRGLAYHRQGVDGNFGSFDFGGRVPGGEEWSLAFGKVCPGDKRIAQRGQILRRAKLIVREELGMDETMVEKFKNELLELCRKYPIPEDREVAHEQQAEVLRIAKAGPQR